MITNTYRFAVPFILFWRIDVTNLSNSILLGLTALLRMFTLKRQISKICSMRKSEHVAVMAGQWSNFRHFPKWVGPAQTQIFIVLYELCK